MNVVFIKEYTASGYIDSSDPKNQSIRFRQLPLLFFKIGSEAEIEEVTNFDKSTSFVLNHLNGKYLIDKDAVEEKQEKVNMLLVAFLAAVVGAGIYLMFKK